MTLPILYSFRRCPYAMRARMTLAYSGLTCELREVLLRDKPPSMLQYSPKGEVPVLVLGDRIIDESRDVMIWSLQQADPDHWLKRHGEHHEQLVERCDAQFKPVLDRYKYYPRYPEQSQAEHRDEAASFLMDLSSRLDNGPYLAGTEVGFADVALVPFIRQFANVDRVWFDSTQPASLVCWLNQMLESDLFMGVMGKYPPWRAGDPITEFPES